MEAINEAPEVEINSDRDQKTVVAVDSSDKLELVELKLKSDGKKQKTPNKLPAEIIPGPSEGIPSEVAVGDDISKKEQPHIDCECEPTFAGAGVPIVCSETSKPSNEQISNNVENKPEQSEVALTLLTLDQSSLSRISAENEPRSGNEPNDASKSEIKTKTSLSESNKSASSVVKNKNLPDCNLLFEKLHKLITGSVVSTDDEASTSSRTPPNTARAPKQTQSTKSVTRPSMIPKLSRPNSYNNQRSSCTSIVRTDALQEKLNLMKCASKPVPAKIKPTNTSTKSSKPNIELSSSFSTGKSPFMGYVPKLVNSAPNRKGLKVKELFTQKEPIKVVPKASSKTAAASAAAAQHVAASRQPIATTSQIEKSSSDTGELNELINHMRKTINDSFYKRQNKSQENLTKQLLSGLNEIKSVVDALIEKHKETCDASTQTELELSECVLRRESFTSRENLDARSDSKCCAMNSASVGSTKSKTSNKVYIKFESTKEKTDSCEKVKTEAYNVPLITSELQKNKSPNVGSVIVEAKSENRLVKADSMDGVFIPTQDPPVNIEEDEEPSGLDITITFPEIKEYLNQSDSRLAVSLSEISEYALKKLKRCPKDFTLHMDFVQGTVQFQSSMSPSNSFLMGPHLKFIENNVADKSGVVNIKPPTECKFSSQPISLENVEGPISHKSLRATDSELFNVVNLPFIYGNNSLNTVTKSCITFRQSDMVSMVYLTKQFFKSTSQIPSLSNITEDKLLENFNRPALAMDKKRKGRNTQKKILTSKTKL